MSDKREPERWVELDWEAWQRPVNIATRDFMVADIDLSLLEETKVGCFRFDDGSVQGWTLKQAFDSSNGNLLKVFSGFTLVNSQKLALAAQAYPFTVLDKAQKADIYFQSPDLSQNGDWHNIVGFELDLQANIWSACYLIPKSGALFAQLQLVLADSGGTMTVLGETTIDPKTNKSVFAFHDIQPYKPYHLTWEPNVFDNAKYKGQKVKYVRVRCTTPHIANFECGVRGEWLIGNICPIA